MAKSSIHKRGPTAPEMNLTPMIDVVFQLIIFFMLVNNIISEEAVQMIVPVLEDPEVKEIPEELKKITVNIVPAEDQTKRERDQAYLATSGDAAGVKVGASQVYPMDDLKPVTDFLEAARQEDPEVQIIVRADAGLHYSEVAKVMRAITQAKIGDVQLQAYVDEQQFGG